MNYPDGVYNLTPHVPWGEVGKGPEDKPYNPEFFAPLCYKAFQTPYPVNDELILVSARKGRGFPTGYSKYDPELEWFDLFMMDYDGNMELIFKGSYNILSAQPVRSRPVPRRIPSSVKWPGRMKYADQKRSLTHDMPGETSGCVGCHETKAVTPLPKPSIATLRAPSEITPPIWGDETVSFPRFVQPVLDRNCISCHGGKKPEAGLDLTHRTEPGTLISWSYVSLVFGDNPSNHKEWAERTIAGMIVPDHVYPNKDVKYPTRETVIPPMTALK